MYVAFVIDQPDLKPHALLLVQTKPPTSPPQQLFTKSAYESVSFLTPFILL